MFEKLKNCSALAIHTGAGMGVDSGLPDFRGNQGFWKAYPKFKEQQKSFIEVANPKGFFENPRETWAFYGHRLKLYRNTVPHGGFQLLKEISQYFTNESFVFTSNVDGHFQKSGYSEHLIEECHGSINHLQCLENCSNDIWSADDLEIEIDDENFKFTSPLPKCPHCGGIASPNILMFGDGTWCSKRSDHQETLRNSWYSSFKKSGIAVIEIGAGKAIPTVRIMSESISDILIRINPRDSEGSNKCISVPSGGLEGIKTVLNYLKSS